MMNCASHGKSPHLFVLSVLPASKPCLFCGHFRWTETETSPSGSLLTRWSIGLLLFSFCWGRHSKVVHSFPVQSWISLGEGVMQIKWLFLSVSMPLFLALYSPGVLKFLTWILEFSETDFGSYIIVKSVFLWGNKDWDFLFCDLADIPSLSYWDNLCEVLRVILICSKCPICLPGYYYYQNHLLLYWTFEPFTEHLYYLLNTSCFCVVYLLPGMAFPSLSTQWTST